VAPIAEIPQRGYTDALLAELEHRAPALDGRRLVSIYVGGGTPSLWQPGLLGEVIAAVAARFAAELADLEVTIEANPIDCRSERLDAWLAAGVNRLSVGLQSIDAAELAVIGRDHSMGQGLEAVDVAAGRFASLTADVILGAPGGARAGLDAVEALADRGVDHLSVYELTIEERAPLGRAVGRGEVAPLDPDTLADLYVAAHELLSARGYDHYEVSSYARPGRRAVHNSLYWSGGEYLGLGSSASSFVRDGDGGVRWTNHRAAGKYLAAPAGDRIAERRPLDAADCARDRVWLGMRTSPGFEAGWLERFDGGPEVGRWLIESGLASESGGRILPSLRGFLFADRVAARVLSYS
jgi:oxygen-independent coproporphyrinogen-3 oxidase